MKRAKKLLIVLLALALSAALLVACNDTDQPTVTQYTLKYSGGEGYTGAIPAEVKAEAGSKVTLEAALDWTGHTFVAWEFDGEEYAPGAEFTMPEKDVTFVAKWRVDGGDPVTYTLSYAGGEVYTGTLPASQDYAEGETVTLADALIESGYTFLKWTYDGKEYGAKASFTMPANNVVMTATWSAEEKAPVAQELGDDFYAAENWEYMTSKNGAEQDGGDIPYSLSDGSIKFHRLNQAIEIGNRDNGTFSFMLKATNDFHFWMNSTGKDNQASTGYRLSYEYGGLRLEIGESLAATVATSTYKKAEWNRFDVVFKTADGKTTISLWINGEKATLTSSGAQYVEVNDAGSLVHTRPARFTTGGWAVVKVWEANNYVQFKPVAKADEKDVPIVAAVGASITEGAGAGNFYTESYPAQLQNALGGEYNVVNLGKSGRTVRTDTGVDNDDAKTPVPWLNNLQFDGFKALKPDIVIINMGTNDSKTSLEPVSTLESFKAAYEHLIDELLKVNPDMRVIVCTVPYAYSDIYDINNNNIENIISPVQRTVAEEKGFELVDLFEITKNKALLFTDGVHPGTTGYHMFAEILEKVVKGSAADLTEEFLNGINERYNDPDDYSIENIHGEIAVENGEIILTVTGNIKIDQKYHEFFKLDLNTGDAAQQSRSVTFDATDDEGNFSVKARLDDLTGTSWYNVRIYYSEFASYLLTLDNVDYTAGKVFKNAERKVTVQTWTSGEKDVFSLQIADLSASDNIVTDITSVAITTADGVKLTVSGTTNAEQLTFYAGVHPTEEGKWRTTELITIEGGAFTHTFDLNKLFDGAAIVSDYINIRLYYEDGSYVVVPLEKTTIDGEKAATGNSFIGEGKKFTIQSWSDSGVGTLSIVVSEYDDSYSVTLGEISFSEGNLVVSGTVTGADSLTFSLSASEDTETYEATAVITEGNFTVSVPLPPLGAVHNGSWYRLMVAANGSAAARIEWAKYTGDFTETKALTHINGTHQYQFVSSSSDIAIIYSDYTPPVPEDVTIAITEISFEGANLKVKGTVTGATALKFSLYASEDDGVYEAEATILEGAFEASIPLPPSGEAHNGSWYRLQVAADGAGAANMTWTEHGEAATSARDLTHSNGGHDYKFIPSSSTEDIAISYSDTPVAPTYSVTVSSSKIEAKEDRIDLTISGTTTDTALRLYIGSDEATQEFYHDITVQEGSFSITFDLATLATGGGWYNVRIYMSDGKYYAVSYEETVNGEGTTLKTDDSFTNSNRQVVIKSWNDGSVKTLSLDVKEYDSSYSVNATSITFEDQYLVVSGNVTGNVESLELALHNDTNMQDNIRETASSLEGGAFEVRLDLTKITLGAGNWLYLWYSVNGGEDAKVQYAKNDTKHVYGDREYHFENWEGIAISYSAYVAPPAEDKTVTVSSMRFEDGKFIVEGTVGESITKIIFHLHNTTDPVFDLSKQAALEGQNFKVEFTLDEIKRGDGSDAPKSYINVRYEINEDGFGTPLNLLPAKNGGYEVGQAYRYAGKTWTLEADGSRTYLNWSENTEAYTLTKVEIADKDGVATLIIEGTYTGEVAYSDLQLKMDKTSETKQEKYVDNTATEAGQFKFEVAVNELLTSAITENSKEEGYFLRLWNKDTNAKIADINSRWASDKLFDKVEIGDSVYYFYRNSLSAWNTLGVVRFEKSALEG